MLPSEAGPGSMRDPLVRFFMRMDEAHKTVDDECVTCHQRIPCDSMRALWVYMSEVRPEGVLG